MGKNKMGTCEQCGRTNTVIAKGLCLKHYHQLKRYGKFLDNNPRNRSDLNEIIKYDDYAEVVLYNYHSVEIARTKIDLSDIIQYLNINGIVDSINSRLANACKSENK